MFKKILIANRGEIACRVMRTCRRLGIATVAVYSEADAGAPHVELADEAVLLGPAAAAESYLVIHRILEACADTGAEAVHPGYGFLSENTGFAEALDEAGVTFIGPPPKAIAAMGDKIEAKKIAAEAGVSTVPGHMGLIEDADEAARIAGEIGYPVMIKASAGGGGKGMRIARDDREAREGFRSARSEAKSSFADDRVFVEKFVEEPRHIEIQVLADGQGNCVYLGERECSIQRRHQKVVEEAPSPFLDAATRKAMGAQAVALAKAVGYRSAGTVEFIVDKDRNFYFLEMNTRLQVEHPVTEQVTGLDLVELMIRVAAGEALPFTQDEVRLEGWSLEARVYAENPARNFLPSIGRLVRYREPAASETVRIDTGVVEGAEISMFYDPMIAKLVTTGGTRAAAIAEMRRALDAYYIRGIGHNLAFLSALVAHPRFQAGDMTTNFIAEEFPEGYRGSEVAADLLHRLLAVAALAQRTLALRDADGQGGPDREKEHYGRWVVVVNDAHHPVAIEEREGHHLVTADGEGIEIEGDWRPGAPLFQGRIAGEAVTVQIDRSGPRLRLTHGGFSVEALVLRPHTAELARRMPKKQPPDLSKYLLSPMPGLLVSLAVAEGQEVKAGDELAVVEAMKMENLLRAEQDGTVVKLHAAPGDSLAVDQKIIEFQ